MLPLGKKQYKVKGAPCFPFKNPKQTLLNQSLPTLAKDGIKYAVKP